MSEELSYIWKVPVYVVAEDLPGNGIFFVNDEAFTYKSVPVFTERDYAESYIAASVPPPDKARLHAMAIYKNIDFAKILRQCIGAFGAKAVVWDLRNDGTKFEDDIWTIIKEAESRTD